MFAGFAYVFADRGYMFAVCEYKFRREENT